MAGNCKPSVDKLGMEASYVILSMSSSQGSGGTTENCGLFNGTNPNEWNTSNVFYWGESTNFLEIDIKQDCNIWRCGTSSWATSNGTLNVFLYNESTSTYDNITSTVNQTTTAITNSNWEKTFTKLKKGKYKFTTGSGLRLDSEWYIEDITPMIWDTTTCGTNASVSTTDIYEAQSATSTNNGIKTNKPLGSGKYYMEFTVLVKGNFLLGICNENASMNSNNVGDTNQIGLYYTGSILPNNVAAGIPAPNAETTIRMCVDTINKNVIFGVDEKFSSTTYSITGTQFYPILRNFGSDNSAIIKANFGQETFKYSVPDGYNRINEIAPMIWDSVTCGIYARIDANDPLKVTTYYNQTNAIKTNVPLGTGKYYMEFTVDYIQSGAYGICNENFDTTKGIITSTNHVSLIDGGNVYPSNKVGGCGSPKEKCIVGIKIDTINKIMSFAVNDKWGTEFAITGEKFYPVLMNFGIGQHSITTANFGTSKFTYNIPDGYSIPDTSAVITKPEITWDKTTAAAGGVISDTNPLQVSVFGSSMNAVKTNTFLNLGKFYMEFTLTQIGGGFVGICNENFNTKAGDSYGSTNQISLYTYGNVYPSQVASGCGTGINANDIVGIKIDTINKKITFAINNKWGTEFALPTGTEYYPLVMNGSSGSTSTIIANFGTTPFTYTIPEGYSPANSDGESVVIYGLLLKSGDKYYSVKEDCYDSVGKTYTPIETVTKESFVTYGFELKDLLTDITINSEVFKPISKFKTLKIVSHESFNPLTLNGIKSNKELIISKQNMNLMLTATTVNRFKQTFTNTNNGTVRLTFSLDNGITWKTWNETNSAFEDLTSTLSLDIDPNNMTDEQLTQWNDFTNDAFTNGISPTVLETLDFTQMFSSTNKTVRFAFVISRPAVEDSITVANTIWNFDKRGRWYKMDSSEVSIGLTPDSCEITALKEDLANVKLNILL